MDADQNAQISTLIHANILGNSESAAIWTPTEYTLRGQCTKDPHKYNSMQYHAREQTSFITPTALQILPLKTNLTKLPVPLTLLTLLAPLLVPKLIPRTQFFPTPTPWLRATPTQTPSNPHHQETISVGSTLPCNHPPTLHNTTTRKTTQLQKSNRTRMINSLFYLKK